MPRKPEQNPDATHEGPQTLHRIYGMPGHLIRRAQQNSVAIFMDSTKEYGLTPVQYATLTVADSNPRIDQRTLASMVAFDRSTIGDVVQRLEQRGLLRRENGTDRRTKLVSITPAGEDVLNAMDQLVMESQVKILQPLSDGEQVILMFLLSKLVHLSNDISRAPLKGNAPEETQQTMLSFLRSTFTRPGMPDATAADRKPAQAPGRRAATKRRP
jgi:DNA-binding MarR family transcriptional regulator